MMENKILEIIHRHDIILASASPRRKELLEQTGIPFRTVVRPVDEQMPEGLTPVEVVRYLCQKKSDMFEPELRHAATIVITADTIVVCDGQVMNKPADAHEAFNMLRQLSGKWHEVHTGVSIRRLKTIRLFHDTTRVHFRELTDNEIRYYIDQYHPFDKAGGYGIQEWIGFIGIDSIEGSYFNVVGLPVHKVYREIQQIAGD